MNLFLLTIFHVLLPVILWVSSSN